MREVIWTDLPVVICPYMPVAEIPIPCCPRLMRNRWNLDPYRSFAKIFGICWRTMPGPLSETVIRKRLAWVGGGGVSPLATASTLTTTSGRIPASSQASSALSTPSLTQVSSAFRGLSNPRRCRLLVKNSETEISRWRAPISSAVTAGFGCGAGGLVFTGGLVFDGFDFRSRGSEGAVAVGFRIWASFGCKDLASHGLHRQDRQGEDRPVLCFPGKGGGGVV